MTITNDWELTDGELNSLKNKAIAVMQGYLLEHFVYAKVKKCEPDTEYHFG